MLLLLLGCPAPTPITACSRPADDDLDGYTASADPACPTEDCDDHDPDVHPDAADVRGDYLDQDCDGEDAPKLDLGSDAAFARIEGVELGHEARIASGDLDGNGTRDLYLEGTAGSWFVPTIPRMGSTEGQASQPLAGAFADLDGDGGTEFAAWLGHDISVFADVDPVHPRLPDATIECSFDVRWMLSGDLDGNDAEDLLVATKTRLMLVYGEAGSLPGGDLLDGPDFYTELGTSPVQAGKIADLDGDGLDDLLGTTRTDDGRALSVLYGEHKRWTGLHDVDEWPRLVAGGLGDSFGAAFAAPDHDGDGYRDPVVSVPADDHDTGLVLVFRGGPVHIGDRTPPERAVLTLFGSLQGVGFGADLDAADLDSDGRDEILVGSSGGAHVFTGEQLGRLDTNDATVSIFARDFGQVTRAVDVDDDPEPEIVVAGDAGGVPAIFLFDSPL